MSIDKYRSSDTFRALVRVLKDYGVRSYQVDDTRPHPFLCFEFAGKPRRVEFAGTPSSWRSPRESGANLRRDMKRWQMEALAPLPGAEAEVQHDESGRAAMPRPVALTFKGSAIQVEGEMLSLTDMHKAQGGDPARQPANWLASADARRFIETLSDLNPGISGNDIVRSVRGGRQPGTWAHWQIAMAYAKYLSPAFHLWVNEVVRAHMEGRASVGPAGLPPETQEIIRRIDGIARMLSHKVTNIEAAIPAMVAENVAAMIAADPRRAVLDYVSVRQMLDEAKALPKGRNAVNRRIGHEMRERAGLSSPPVPLRRCPHSGVWLFPRDFAAQFMAERGAGLVRDHNAAVAGQGVIDFRAARRATHQDNAPV
jgi:hypothetical protein